MQFQVHANGSIRSFTSQTDEPNISHLIQPLRQHWRIAQIQGVSQVQHDHTLHHSLQASVTNPLQQWTPRPQRVQLAPAVTYSYIDDFRCPPQNSQMHNPHKCSKAAFQRQNISEWEITAPLYETMGKCTSAYAQIYPSRSHSTSITGTVPLTVVSHCTLKPAGSTRVCTVCLHEK
jgi:hypothetical protein